MTNDSTARIPLGKGAKQAKMTPYGLQKTLERTNNLIRENGHLFVYANTLSEIERARSILGFRPRGKAAGTEYPTRNTIK
jgi:hypothetical protein